MIDSQFFGMNAGGHLLVNAVIHVANTLLLFWLLLGTTRARWPSALVAALFALHPLHVESVAWAAERKDTLSTFFGLLSLIAYMHYVETRSSKSVRMDCHNPCARIIGQTDAGDLAFRNVVTRLLAVAAIWQMRREEYRRGASHRKAAIGICPVEEITVVSHRCGVGGHHIRRAIS